MSRLPLALIWLLAAIAGALPAARPVAEWRGGAGIIATESGDVPPLTKPTRIETPLRSAGW